MTPSAQTASFRYSTCHHCMRSLSLVSVNGSEPQYYCLNCEPIEVVHIFKAAHDGLGSMQERK